MLWELVSREYPFDGLPEVALYMFQANRADGHTAVCLDNPRQ